MALSELNLIEVEIDLEWRRKTRIVVEFEKKLRIRTSHLDESLTILCFTHDFKIQLRFQSFSIAR